MFTGLVADLGVVEGLQPNGAGATIAVRTALAPELAHGDSVAINGVCLTAVEIGAHHFSADVIAETLERSSLGALAVGSKVNVELPLRAADRLGGHFVLGHVDGTGEVVGLHADGRLTVAVPPRLLRYIVEKGSVALDGVSLTVADVDDETLTVALIPETLGHTTLGGAVAGKPINIEVDVLAKHVEKLVATRPLGVKQ
jgi:riboflavin synthase